MARAGYAVTAGLADDLDMFAEALDGELPIAQDASRESLEATEQYLAWLRGQEEIDEGQLKGLRTSMTDYGKVAASNREHISGFGHSLTPIWVSHVD